LLYKKENWDNLKYSSMFFVVLIHVSGLFLLNKSENLNYWALILNQISRFSVPAFLVASGYGLTISKKYELGFFEFIKERATKILPTFLLISTFYYIVFYGISDILSVKAVLIIISGKSYYHLYYIVILFMCYILFKALHNLVKLNAHLILLISLIIQLLSQTLGILEVIQINEYNLFNWFFYFILGIYLANKQIIYNFKNGLLLTSIFLSFVLVIFSNIFLFSLTNSVSIATTSMSPFITLFSILSINCLLKNPIDVKKLFKIDISFYVYLIHPFFVALFSKILNVSTNINFIYFIIVFLLVFISSVFASLFIDLMIKIIKKQLVASKFMCKWKNPFF